jgi:septal ring factor EnvC (AmiA/AmiB activator)
MIRKRFEMGMGLPPVRFGRGALFSAALLASLCPALAQNVPSDLWAGEPRNAERDVRANEERRRLLEAEAEAIRTDRARLNAALIETSAKMRQAQGRMADIERRLELAAGSEEAIRKSLAARRDVLADILATLQRMGRRPPPAVLASPEDALRAVRASMMLGALLPELRIEAQSLASDLTDLMNLRKSIALEKDRLDREAQVFARDGERLATLVEARQSALREAEQKLAEQRQRSAELARQSGDVKELISRSESEIAAAGRAAAEARAAEENMRKAADAAQARGQPRVAALPFNDPSRLAPKIAFADARGRLPLPAAGRLLKNFGAPDGLGSTEKGLSIGTRPSAPVSAPADGWVAFSGPYRTYGQLLIINAGGGYYVVLAGMERISVEVGQFVLAGEPVATMGDGSTRTASAVALGASQPIGASQALGAGQPVLYVEFRKDGAAIDPGPWWAKAELEKVRG